MRQRQPGAIVGALGLILFGSWMLAVTFGVPLVGFSQIWPVIPILFGLASLAQCLSGPRKQSGLIFLGVLALLTGIFLSLFTFQIGRLTWPDMANYWPIFPLIVGIAFMALYLTDGMRQEALLVPTFITGGAGVLALPFTLGVIRGAVFNQAVRLWPLLLLLVGLAILIKPRSRRAQ